MNLLTLILVLVCSCFLLVSCKIQKIKGDFNRDRVECSFVNEIPSSAKIFQIRDQNNQKISGVSSNKLKSITIGDIDIKERLSDQGCFFVKDNEGGVLKITSTTDHLGYWSELKGSNDIDIFSISSRKIIKLEKYDSIKDDLIAVKILKNFCKSDPKSNADIVSTKDNTFKIPFSLDSLKILGGLTVKVLADDNNITADNLILSTFVDVNSKDQDIKFDLKSALNKYKKENNQVKVILKIKDIFDEEIEKNCLIQYDPSPSVFESITGINKTTNAYQIDPERIVELTINKNYPLTAKDITIYFNQENNQENKSKNKLETFYLTKVVDSADEKKWKISIKVPEKENIYNLEIHVGDEKIFHEIYSYKIDYGQKIYHQGIVKKIFFSNNERYLFSSSENGETKISELESTRAVKTIKTINGIYKHNIIISADNKKVAFCSNSKMQWEIKIIDLEDNSWEKRLIGQSGECSNLFFNNERNKLTYIINNSKEEIEFINTWDFVNDKLDNVYQSNIVSSKIKCKLANSNDNTNYLFLSCNNGKIDGFKIYDLKDKKYISVSTIANSDFNLIHNQNTQNKNFEGYLNNDNSYFVSYDLFNNPKINIFNFKKILNQGSSNTNEPLNIFQIPSYESEKINKLYFSSNGKWIGATTTDKLTTLYRIGQHKIHGHISDSEKVNSMDFFPYDNYVLTANSNGIIKVYNMETLNVVQRLSTQYETNIVKFSPKGTYIVSADISGEIKIQISNFNNTKTILQLNGFFNTKSLANMRVRTNESDNVSGNDHYHYMLYPLVRDDDLFVNANEPVQFDLIFYDLKNESLKKSMALPTKSSWVKISKSAKYLISYLDGVLSLYLIDYKNLSLVNILSKEFADLSEENTRFVADDFLVIFDGENSRTVGSFNLNDNYTYKSYTNLAAFKVIFAQENSKEIMLIDKEVNVNDSYQAVVLDIVSSSVVSSMLFKNIRSDFDSLGNVIGNFMRSNLDDPQAPRQELTYISSKKLLLYYNSMEKFKYKIYACNNQIDRNLFKYYTKVWFSTDGEYLFADNLSEKTNILTISLDLKINNLLTFDDLYSVNQYVDNSKYLIKNNANKISIIDFKNQTKFDFPLLEYEVAKDWSIEDVQSSSDKNYLLIKTVNPNPASGIYNIKVLKLNNVNKN
ncbi:MAG: hypothetical protein HQK49_06590 [Oligoflexia bacterium]|nr:hypothetical protein [Oligoflexia bacterium]